MAILQPKRGRIRPRLDLLRRMGDHAWMPRMHESKIRFGFLAWRLIQAEARRDGVSVSQFVREAAIGRAVMQKVRHDPSFAEEFDSFLEDLRRE